MQFKLDKRFQKKESETYIDYFNRVLLIPCLFIVAVYWFIQHGFFYKSTSQWLGNIAINDDYGLAKVISIYALYFLLLCYLKFVRVDYGEGQKTKVLFFHLYRYTCIILEIILVINSMCFMVTVLDFIRYNIVSLIAQYGWSFKYISLSYIKGYLNFNFDGNGLKAIDAFVYYSFIPSLIILLAYKFCYSAVRDILFNRFNVRLSKKMQKRVGDKFKKENLTMSDVDEEHNELEKVAATKQFDPLKYALPKDTYKMIAKVRKSDYQEQKIADYKLDRLNKSMMDSFKKNGLLVGLNQDNLPVTIDYETWQTSHTSICGLTGRGKGVATGCLLAQNIWLGFCNIICDPKKNGGDKWMFYVMEEMLRCYNAIYGTNRKVHYLNLNLSEPQLNFLKGITKLDFKECLSAGFNLVMKDTDADHYRKNDIEQMEYLSELIDTVDSMPEYWENLYTQHLDALLNPKSNLKAEDKAYDDIVKDHISSFARDLRSLALMPVLRTSEGIDLEQAILNGDVIYINGSSDSTNIKRLQKMLLHRCIQIVAKTANNEKRPHVTFFIDETTYFLSRPLKTAVSTIRDQRANFVFNFQGIDNLRDVSESDPSLDGKIIESVILNNSGTNLVYKVNHESTRQWAAKMTGEKIVNAISKEVEGVSGDYGTVDATGKLKINPKKEAKFHANVFGLLPKRVGVMFGDNPAELVFTSPILVHPNHEARRIRRFNTYKMKSYFFRIPSLDGEEAEQQSIQNVSATPTKPQTFKPKAKKTKNVEAVNDDGLPSIHDIFDDEPKQTSPLNKPKESNSKPKFPTKVTKS